MYVHGTTQLLVTILLITDSTVCMVTNLKRTDNFRFSECSWDGNTCAEIKDVNWEPGDIVSDWPPGPYALPMPIDGCPESKWKGWEQGYIDFTWRNPYAVLTRNISISDVVNDNDTTVDLEDITLVQITDIQSLIMGPYNRYRIKLNFCFKLRNDPILDIGEWINDSFGIYGDISGCPQGFAVEEKLIKLPKTSFWVSDGYLPYFTLNRRQQNEELRIRICTRSKEFGADSETNTLPSDEPFVLLYGKENPIQCFVADEMTVTAVLLYMQPILPDPNNDTTMTSLMAVCYYWPIKWLNGFIDTFVFANVYISKGTVSAESYLFLSRQVESADNQINGLSEILTHSLKETTQIDWTMIDLGRTTPVTAVFQPLLENDNYPRCFISNGKWDFLHYSALSCSYRVTGYYMHFNRIMEGRFVVLTKDRSFATVTETVTSEVDVLMKVFTTDQLLSYYADKSLPCKSDMGMTDLNIDDLDMLSSSSQPEFPAEFARPTLRGWCAEMNDTSPFIMIRFRGEVRLDGITIQNWEGTFKAAMSGIVEKQFFRMGTKSFKISLGLTEDNLTTYSDFKLDYTQYIKSYPTRPGIRVGVLPRANFD